jgi:hypothetical protein
MVSVTQHAVDLRRRVLYVQKLVLGLRAEAASRSAFVCTVLGRDGREAVDSG